MSRIQEIGHSSASPGLYQISEAPKACPHCSSAATRVLKTEAFRPLGRVRRRRNCLCCGHTYYTWSDAEE